MRITAVRPALAAAALAAVLVGCQVSSQAPTAGPTFTCTPEAGGAEFECSQFQHDQMVAKDKLYAEAEAVYRKFLAEDVRIMRAGGVGWPSRVILETTTGDFLAEVDAFYRDLREGNVRFEGGDFALVSLKRMPGLIKGESRVAMQSCVDARTTRLMKGDQLLRSGSVAKDTFYFGTVEGALRIIGADGREVNSCD